MSALALQDVAPGPATLAALKRRVQALAPKQPGTYEFRDPAGGVIYVGKAKDLRTRLLSYFTAPWPESKSARLIRCAQEVRWRTLPSEFAALLEEQRLISRLRPAYNVRGMRTRAMLAFVKLTRGPAPRLVVTDKVRDTGAMYWGPFRGKGQTEDAIRTLSDLLGLRDCADRTPMTMADQSSLFDAPQTPLCMRFDLGSCLGPCAARVAAERYGDAAAAAADFLESRSAHPLDRALAAMDDAAVKQEFERAVHWRDKLESLTWLFAATARLRAAVDGLSFVYAVKDESGNGDDRVYLIHRGTVRTEAAWPRTPLEQQAFAESIRAHTAEPGGLPAARTGAEMQELLLVMSWFRQHPEAYEATSPSRTWLATV